MRHPLIFTAIMALSACSANPPIHSVAKGMKTVAYLQYGTEPLAYNLGIVDGPSFWGGASSSTDMAMPDAAKRVAEDTNERALERDRKFAKPIIGGMLSGIDIVGRMRSEVMPEFALRWNLPYGAKYLRMRRSNVPLMDANQNLAGVDPGTDLLVVFYVNNIRLNERPGFSSIFHAAYTLGTTEKEVAPEIWAGIKVFKRDPGSKKLKLTWSGYCSLNVFDAPETIDYGILKTKPAAGKSVMKKAVDTFIKECKQHITGLE